MTLPDIFRHNLIEASAGTGKTFIIENIFVEILKKTDVKIEQILAVTFTEKAAGDLKKRIRENIIRSMSDEADSKIKGKLASSLNDYDQASIYTIHGFCNRILKEYSFENGTLFKFEIKDEKEINEKMLYRQMRDGWNEKYGAELEEILEFSDFTNPSKFKRLILKTAGSFITGSNNRILPEVNESFIDDIAGVRIGIEGAVENIKSIIGYKKELRYEDNMMLAYAVRYIIARSLDRVKKIILSGLYRLITCNDKNRIIKTAYRFFYDYTSKEEKSVRRYFDVIVKNENKGKLGPFIDLTKVLDELFDFLRENEKKIINQLTVQTVVSLKHDAGIYKKQNGYITYNDMIMSVNNALKNRSFAEIIGKKYAYGIVDEFQDTDFLQWNIIKSIFPPEGINRLFLIADPKQAIYGFRGADIFTYFQARKEMAEKYGAPFLDLDVNYRSSKNLTESLNCFYTKSGYFKIDSNNGIVYKSVSSGDRNKVVEPYPGRSSVNIVDLGNCSFREAKQMNAVFIAGEIRKICGRIKINYKNEERYLTEKDICILIRKSAESSMIEDELKNNRIPYSFYKKSGLYDTVEAKNIFYLFNALANPDDIRSFYKSLLTGFFNVGINELENIKLENDSSIMKIFNKWTYFSEIRDYQRLFRSIITDSGFIYRLLNDADGERKITNIEQVLQSLEKTAMNENLDMTGLANILKNRMKKEVEIEDGEDLQKRETESDKVQIMTMHASKGLEFPVVFIAGGFTKGNRREFYKFHDENGVVFDLNKNNGNEIKNSEEEDGEEKRLYYVAFTRAVFYLYVPYFKPLKKTSPGPIAEFIKDGLEKTFIDGESPGVSIIKINDALDEENRNIIFRKPEEKMMIPEILFPEIDRTISSRITSVKSFSGIKKEKEFKNVFNNKENDEILDTSGKIYEEDLPGGSKTGNMFHSILEKTDYKIFLKFNDPGQIKTDGKTVDLISGYFDFYIEKNLSKKQKSKSSFYFDKILEILFNTLKTPIDSSGFRLCDIEVKDRLNEVEFYFPLPEIADSEIRRFRFKDGFIKGFIDMVFRKDGKYYFIDWKSNKYPEYSGIPFEERVKKDYELQYKIYSIAVINWLRGRLKSFDYDKNFGGIYYIYLRGRSFNHPESGLFFYREDTDPTENYKSELTEILSK